MQERERTMVAAVKEGDLAAVERLLAEDASQAEVRDEGVSLVLIALYHGQRAAAELVASHRHRFEVHELAALGRCAELRELLARAPDEAQRFSLDGFTPLGLAASFGPEEVVCALLDAGADPRIASRNARRATALHAALARGSESIARLLLDRGADANAPQAGGTTPLHEAAGSGRRQLAELLVERGADPTALDGEGRSPGDLARARGHFALADWLGGVAGG